MKIPTLKVPLSISFASAINAMSIPLIAFLLWWTMDRVLEPNLWCPALEEFKLTNVATVVQLRCQQVILAQLGIAKFAVTGLVGALALSHLVSVAREAKASLDLSTKIGNLKIGGDGAAAAAGAQHVKEAADEAAEQVQQAVDKPVDDLPPSPALEWPMNAPAAAAPLGEPQGKGFTAPPGEDL